MAHKCSGLLVCGAAATLLGTGSLRSAWQPLKVVKLLEQKAASSKDCRILVQTSHPLALIGCSCDRPVLFIISPSHLPHCVRGFDLHLNYMPLTCCLMAKQQQIKHQNISTCSPEASIDHFMPLYAGSKCWMQRHWETLACWGPQRSL